jgi:hypothetical protein
MLSNTTNRYQQFQADLAEIINNIDKNDLSLNRNSSWINSVCLGLEMLYLEKMTQDKNFPKVLKPDVETTYTTIHKFRKKHGGI